MESKSTAAGMVVGTILKVLVGITLLKTIFVAFVTGLAAYFGQLAGKYIVSFIKSRIK